MKTLCATLSNPFMITVIMALAMLLTMMTIDDDDKVKYDDYHYDPKVPTIFILRSLLRKSSTVGVETAVALPKANGHRWGASPPTCARGFWEGGGRFESKIDDFGGRLLKIIVFRPLGIVNCIARLGRRSPERPRPWAPQRL